MKPFLYILNYISRILSIASIRRFIILLQILLVEEYCIFTLNPRTHRPEKKEQRNNAESEIRDLSILISTLMLKHLEIEPLLQSEKFSYKWHRSCKGLPVIHRKGSLPGARRPRPLYIGVK